MVSWLNKCCWEHRSQSTAAYKKSCWFSMLRFIWKLKYIKFGNLQACWNVYIVMMKMAGLNIFNLSYIIDIIYYIWMFVFLTFLILGLDPGMQGWVNSDLWWSTSISADNSVTDWIQQTIPTEKNEQEIDKQWHQNPIGIRVTGGGNKTWN